MATILNNANFPTKVGTTLTEVGVFDNSQDVSQKNPFISHCFYHNFRIFMDDDLINFCITIGTTECQVPK